jgi:hypothetical protein
MLATHSGIFPQRAETEATADLLEARGFSNSGNNSVERRARTTVVRGGGDARQQQASQQQDEALAIAPRSFSLTFPPAVRLNPEDTSQTNPMR